MSKPSADAIAGEREVHALRDEISHLRGAIEEACDALVRPADDRLIRIQRVITHLRAELAASRERSYLIRQTAGAASSAPTACAECARLREALRAAYMFCEINEQKAASARDGNITISGEVFCLLRKQLRKVFSDTGTI